MKKDERRMTIEQIEQAAMELSVEDREHLAERLMASLPADPEVAERWYDEAERRLAAHRAGRMKAVPIDEVLEELGIEPLD